MIRTIEGNCLTTQLKHCGNVEFELLNNCQDSFMTTQIQCCCNIVFKLFYNSQTMITTSEGSCLITQLQRRGKAVFELLNTCKREL